MSHGYTLVGQVLNDEAEEAEEADFKAGRDVALVSVILQEARNTL